MAILLTDDYLQSSTARTVPGAFFDREAEPHGWYLDEPTPRAATVALKLFPTLANDYPELAELRDSLIRDVRPYANAEAYGKRAGREDNAVTRRLDDLGLNYYDYQSLDLGYLTDILTTYGAAYLGWERGLGKTLGACTLMETTEAKRILVICPNTAKQAVWAGEIEKWLGYETVVLRNSAGQRTKDLGYFDQLHRSFPDKPLILVVHYEALAIIAGTNKKGWDKLPKWDLVVCDEAHRLSNTSTKMHKALMKIPARMKLAMSGSIISNHAEEMYGQLKWLYPDRYRSRWRDWNDRFLDYVDGRWGRICVGVKPDRLSELQEELGVFMVYRRASDSLDLPDRREQTLYVDLTASQRKVYNDLITDAMADMPDGSVLKADDGLALLGRLRQVSSGLSLVSDEAISDSSKLDLAVDLVTENGDEPVVVFAWYKKSARELYDRLTAKGVECFVVDGDVAQAQRAEYIAEFQSGAKQVFIGTIKTLGESVTLTRANQLIMLDRSWNPTDNDQAVDRIYRIGQERPVLVTHIVARDTVDEFRVTPVIADKAALRRMILGG